MVLQSVEKFAGFANQTQQTTPWNIWNKIFAHNLRGLFLRDKNRAYIITWTLFTRNTTSLKDSHGCTLEPKELSIVQLWLLEVVLSWMLKEIWMISV